VRALITGACGFSGRHLATHLKAQRHTVQGIDVVAGATPAWLDGLAQADVTDLSRVAAIVRAFKPTAVFHLAGSAKGDRDMLHRLNVIGTMTLLESIRQEAADAGVVVAGSAAEYGHVRVADQPVMEAQPCRPASAYGITKHEATLQALAYASRWGMHIAVARPFNIIGAGVPADLVVGALVARIRLAAEPGADRTVAIGNLSARRDFIAIDDVVDAYERMVTRGVWGEVFNICSGKGRAIRDVADRLCRLAEVPVELRVDPALVRTEEVPVMVGSGAKAKELLGFLPSRSFEDALQSAWYGWSAV
jgi:GDP-4-dehydro-6-deoxy-D-mannose reductase